MAQDHTRRSILRVLPALAFGLLAGCSGVVSNFTGPPPDLVVFNRTSGSITTSVAVREQANNDSVFSKQTDIDSNKAAEYADALPASGDYTLQVDTNGGLSGTHDWTIGSEDQSMQVRVQNDSMNFDTVSP